MLFNHGKDNVPNSDIDILAAALKVLYESDREELAFRLIERFGNVNGVFSASFDELRAVPGITDRVAAFFATVRPAARQVLLRSMRDMTIRSEADAIRFAAAYFANNTVPTDAIVYLSGGDKVADVDRSVSCFDTRSTVARICRHTAQKILWIRNLAHTKPRATPYELKRAHFMLKLLKTIELLGVRVVDYITIADNKFIGLRNGMELRNATEASAVRYPPPQSFIKRFERVRDIIIDKIREDKERSPEQTESDDID